MCKFALSWAALGGLLTLAACSATDRTNAVFAAEGAYAAAAHAASQYEGGRFGTPVAAIVAQIKAYDTTAYADLTTLRTAAENGQALDGAKLVAAQTAIATLSTYVQENAK